MKKIFSLSQFNESFHREKTKMIRIPRNILNISSNLRVFSTQVIREISYRFFLFGKLFQTLKCRLILTNQLEKENRGSQSYRVEKKETFKIYI